MRAFWSQNAKKRNFEIPEPPINNLGNKTLL